MERLLEVADRRNQEQIDWAMWWRVSAFLEHVMEVTHMARSTLVRWAGLAAALGGAVFLVSMLTPLRGPLRAAVPGSVACMALGAVGLYAALQGRNRHLERLGLILAGIGLALGFMGMAGSALGVLEPNPLAPIINTGEHAGLVFIGAGMVAWGVLAMRTSALGRWSVVPIPIGIFGLTGIAVLVPPTFADLEASVLPLVFSITWMMLGFALLINGGNAGRLTVRPN